MKSTDLHRSSQEGGYWRVQSVLQSSQFIGQSPSQAGDDE